MGAILQDLHVSFRSLIVRPAFAAVAVLTLALGVGATTALFSVVHGVLLRPLPYLEADRIVTLCQTARDNPGPNVSGSVSHVNYLDWKSTARSFESMAAYSGAGFVVTGLGEPEIVSGAVVTPDFFSVMGAKPIVGREFTREDDRANGPRVVVIGHGFWKDRRGGRTDPVGSTLEVGGRTSEIVGVAPQGFAYPAGARIWSPVQNNDDTCGRGCVYLNGIARLAPGAALESARDEMRSIAARLEKQFPDDNTNTTVGLTRLQDQLVGDVRPALLTLFGAVVMVLLIACANVANLLLVRGAARRGEIAVRAALGAGRGRLVRFLLMESAILAAAGAATGLLMAWWGVDALKQLAPQNIPRLNGVGFSGATFIFALGTAALTSMLFGLGPAVQLMRTPLVSLIGGRGETGHGRTRWSRSTLLVVEVGLSLVLLVGAGLLLRSMSRLHAIEPGWRSEGITILTLSLPSSRYPDEAGVVRGFDRLDERFEAIPGVAAVARIDIMPLGPGEIVRSFTRTDRPAPEPGELPGALYCVVDPDYFPTAGIPLVSGRYFDGRDRDGGPPVLIISREMADRFWRGEDPVGKAVQIGTSRPTVRTIVGVVEGVRSANLSAPPQPEMYVPHAQTGARSMTFLLASALPPAQVLAGAREVVRDMDARLPLIRPGTFAALESAALARPRFYLLLLSLFALLAVALAAVGVYGVVAYIVTQRTREIAVRVALGAPTSEVLRLVMWQGLRPALAGIALGLLAALGAGRVLSGLLYEIEPADPATIATVMVVLVAIVAVACAVPALRAARIPAADALRTNH